MSTKTPVRWREGGIHHQRTFKGVGHKDRADIFKGEVARRKEMGGLDFLEAGKQTLGDFAETWLTAKKPNLSANTLRGYVYLLDTHIDPVIGAYKLSELRPSTLDEWQASRLNAGAGREAVGKAGTLLHGILKRAVALELIGANPAEVLERPKVQKRPKRPLSPVEVEGIRQSLLEDERQGDAVLVSLLAYAGLRPYSEALARTWGDVTDDKLRMDTHLVEGQIVDGSKTGLGGVRSISLLAPLQQDLSEWRQVSSGASQGSELIFPRRDGKPWTRTDYGNWRSRVFKKATDANPKDLRDTFISLLIHQGLPVTEVAAQAGHSPNTTLRVYAHVIQGVESNVPAETLIAEAREKYRA